MGRVLAFQGLEPKPSRFENSNMAIMFRDAWPTEFPYPILARNAARVSALRHDIPGDCVQRISGVLPHLAAGGGAGIELDWDACRPARYDSRLHGILAA